MKSPIPIIIVTFNKVEEFTIPCIESIMKNTSQPYEIIVIDNNSHDNTVEILNNKYKHINVIGNKENSGWAGGNLIGIEYIMNKFKSDYFCLLNSDTLVSENWLEKLHSIIDSNDKCVSISPVENVINHNWFKYIYNNYICKNIIFFNLIKCYPFNLLTGKGLMQHHAVDLNSLDNECNSLSLSDKVVKLNAMVEGKYKNKVSSYSYITTGYCLLLKSSIINEYITFLENFDTLFPYNAISYWKDIFSKRNVKHFVSKGTYVYHFRGGSGGY